MRIFLLIFSTIFFSTSVLAQGYNPERVGKKAMNHYTRAMQLAQEGDFSAGIRALEEAVQVDPGFADALLSLAGMHGELKNYQQSVDYYQQARKIDSIYFSDYALPYSINLAGLGRFEEALLAVEEFLQVPNLNESSLRAGSYRKKTYQFAIRFAKEKGLAAYKFEPVNLGGNINSEVSEYYPTLTLDGSRLIFTRRVRNINEDFYGADRTPEGWSTARGLMGNINSNLNEGAQNISQDGEWLIFTGCNFPEGLGSCDLYISYLTDQGWSEPENLGSVINSEAWDSAPSLSPDKRDLYFASTRPGGYGGSDIYVSRRSPDGRWSRPENLGPEINTAGDESCPFIHADNQNLYFTSSGHTGYGGDDLFRARKSGNAFSAVENLGFPINTIENEGSLIVAADGKTAYYASDRADSKGGLDLYSFELREDIRPIRTLWVKGKVFDKETKKGLPSAVELFNLETGELISRVQTDETGNYLITLPVGTDYAFNVNRKGYLFFSGNFPLAQNLPDSVYAVDIPLQPLNPDASIILNNIFFDVNQFELQPSSTVELDKIVTLLTENPELKIRISGHTDNVGQDAANLLLSRNRARSVVNYLISKGISASRLSYEGYGATKPIDTNETPEGRSRNRRTELNILQ